MQSKHETDTTQKTQPAEFYRGFTIALTPDPTGIYAKASIPGGVQWVTPPYREATTAVLYARSLVDRYLRALELADSIPFPEDLQAMIANIVEDVAAHVAQGRGGRR